MNFTKAEEKLNGRDSKKLQNNTYLVRINADTIGVRLHTTEVVLIHRNNTWTLNNGGWLTVTTKDRINAYSPARLSQVRGNWFLWTGSETLPYHNGVVIDESGCPVTPWDNVCRQGEYTAPARSRRRVSRIVHPAPVEVPNGLMFG